MMKMIFSRCFLLWLFLAGLAVAARAHEDSLPGGRRALQLELGGKWIGNGISFSTYRDGQSPEGAAPSEAEVLADLRLAIRYWNLIRMYDITPATERVLRVIRREKLPIRAIVGAWVTASRTAAEQAKTREQVDGLIRLANEYSDIVIAAAVGNEACVSWSDHRTEPANLIRLVREVRAAIRQPVTTADDYNFWNKEESKAVAAELDFITFHTYALWNGQPLAEAMAWTGARYDEAVKFHAGTPIIIGETGWTTSFDPSRQGPGDEGTLMKAEVSVAAQGEYLRQHYHWVRDRKVPTILFEAFDENWKGGGSSTPAIISEKHWGVFDSERRPKASFEAIVREFYPTAK